ncbi:MAG: hypothetical protein JJE25_06980 [Bacteroidia bacterium]|nr:hypothetical protein [Bacteroidia bacterium]
MLNSKSNKIVKSRLLSGKKLILASTVLLLSIGAIAQQDSSNRNMNHDMNNNKMDNSVNHQPMDNSHPDGVMMQNGKVMMVRNGKMTPMDHDMTMSNGTKVMSTGTILKKDGTKMMMKDGQHIDMSGNIMPMQNSRTETPVQPSQRPTEKNNLKPNRDKNMYLVPDSTLKKDSLK